MTANSPKKSAGSERSLRTSLSGLSESVHGAPATKPLPEFLTGDLETSSTRFSILKSRPTSGKNSVVFDFGFLGMPEGKMRLRDLFGVLDGYSVPAKGLADEHLFQKFEPITMDEPRPDWATVMYRWRSAMPPFVPLTVTGTWLEGRWTARVNTGTFPVKITAWFENPDDVVLLRLAGMPLFESKAAQVGRL